MSDLTFKPDMVGHGSGDVVELGVGIDVDSGEASMLAVLSAANSAVAAPGAAS